MQLSKGCPAADSTNTKRNSTASGADWRNFARWEFQQKLLRPSPESWRRPPEYAFPPLIDRQSQRRCDGVRNGAVRSRDSNRIGSGGGAGSPATTSAATAPTTAAASTCRQNQQCAQEH